MGHKAGAPWKWGAFLGKGPTMEKITGVKVFTATKAMDRECLGEKATAWLKANPGANVVDKVVTQSSDEAFHCLTITLFLGAANEGYRG